MGARRIWQNQHLSFHFVMNLKHYCFKMFFKREREWLRVRPLLPCYLLTKLIHEAISGCVNKIGESIILSCFSFSKMIMQKPRPKLSCSICIFPSRPPKFFPLPSSKASHPGSKLSKIWYLSCHSSVYFQSLLKKNYLPKSLCLTFEGKLLCTLWHSRAQTLGPGGGRKFL